MSGILVLSDLHLRPAVRMSRTEIAGDCLHSIQYIGELVKTYRPDSAIIAGDVFHQTRESDEELKLFTELVKVLSFSMNPDDIFVIQGNHDRGTNCIAELFNCTDLNKSEVADIQGLRVVGKKYGSVKEYIQFLSELDGSKYDIVVMHAPCKPFSNFSAEVLDPVEFPKGPLYIVGDTHVSDIYNKEVTVISPGCLYPATIEELRRADKCCGGFLLSVDNGKITGAHKFGIPCRRHKEYKEGVSIQDLWDVVTNSHLPAVIEYRGDVAFPPFPKEFIGIKLPDKIAEESESTIDPGLPILEKIAAVTEELVGDDPDKADTTSLVRDLAITDDPALVVNEFVKKKTKELQAYEEVPESVEHLIADCAVSYTPGDPVESGEFSSVHSKLTSSFLLNGEA